MNIHIYSKQKKQCFMSPFLIFAALFVFTQIILAISAPVVGSLYAIRGNYSKDLIRIMLTTAKYLGLWIIYVVLTGMYAIFHEKNSFSFFKNVEFSSNSYISAINVFVVIGLYFGYILIDFD